MNCPHCQRLLPDPSVATCPFCQQPISADTTAARDPYAEPTVIQGAPGTPASGPTPPAHPPTPAEQPTLTYTPQQPPQQPAQAPAYTPPVYTPPQPPLQPPMPTPGQGIGQLAGDVYSQPGYSPAPPQPWAGQMPAEPPRKKSRAGCVVGCLVALVLVLGLVGGAIALLNSQAGGVTIGGATIGGKTTGPTGGTVIYQDALNGSTKDNWTNDSNCFFKDKGYHINAAFICYAPADKIGDATTTVSVMQISGPITYPYGLAIRRVSKGNYYEFLIDANGKWLFDKVVNGTATNIVKLNASDAIKHGLNQPNTLSVQAKGSHFIFSINGTKVGEADDSTFSEGKTGLVGYQGIEVVYTDLSIEHLKS